MKLSVKKESKSRILSPVAVLLVLAAAAGLMASAIIGGIVPGFVGGIYSHSPTITYQEFLAVDYIGVYHVIQAQPVCNSAFPPCFEANETLFLLTTENGSVRLMFYCGTTREGVTTITGWLDLCSNSSQLELNEGICLHVKGTLLQPSSWPSRQYHPLIRFEGDLVVFSYNQLAQASCS